MNQPMIVEKEIWRYENGGLKQVRDPIVTECPITIILNGEEFATLVCSPDHLDDMIIGFLASEGIIRKTDEIKELTVIEATGRAVVETNKINKLNEKLHSKRIVSSCCGKSRQSFYFYNDARTVKPIENIDVKISTNECFQLMEQLQESSSIFKETGGVHNAALCDKNGILITRTDIGRHNALDKIYGHCLKHDILLQDKILVFSGRISSEVLLKVAKIGCGIILSKSAPTELALRLANELKITTIGFLRHDSFNVYSHPERIIEHKIPTNKENSLDLGGV